MLTVNQGITVLKSRSDSMHPLTKLRSIIKFMERGFGDEKKGILM